jgi:RNA polymerase sigma factor (sigma-70 family)
MSKKEKLKELIENNDIEGLIIHIKPFISKMIYRYTKRKNEDLEQECFIKLLSILNKNKDVDNLLNKLISFIRVYNRRTLTFDGLTVRQKDRLIKLFHMENLTEEEIKEKENIEKQIITTDTHEPKYAHSYTIFDEAKDILNSDEYDLIYKIYKCNYTYDDLGKELGISKVAVKKRLRKILEKLKIEMG